MKTNQACEYCHSTKGGGCKVNGKYYCNSCYGRIYRYGSPIPRERKSTNTFSIVNNNTLVITLKNVTKYYADAEDKELLEKYSWCKAVTGYAVANIGNKVTKMHRYILGITDPKVIVDHKNRSICDNRKQNLRICSVKENARNKSVSKNCKTGHLGIRMTKEKKYNVRITFNRKEIHVGNYDTLELAINAREAAENKYHKEFGSHLGDS